MTTVLFDFFGTLVDHSAVDGDFWTTHGLLTTLGATSTHDEFRSDLAAVYAHLSARADVEFSGSTVGDLILSRQLGRTPRPDEVALYVEVYLREWASRVIHLDGLADWLRALRARHRLAIVSNTHSPTMVPEMLDTIGVADLFDAVVLSVEVGRPKPHPAIYQHALSSLDVSPADAVFVGDSYDADFTGPRAAGMSAYLIDPGRRYGVPEAYRLDTIFDLATRLP